jgi:hypothetical protein
MNKYTQLDARCEGFYSTTGMVNSLQEATLMDVSKAPVNLTVLPGKMAIVVSGKITLPEGLVVPDSGLGVRLSFLGYRTVYTSTKDVLFESIDVQFAKGERSKSYSLLLPNIEGYYHMDIVPAYGSEKWIPYASYDGKGFSPSVLDRYPLKTGADLTLNFTAPKVTKTASLDMGETIKNAPKVSVNGTLSLPAGDVVSANGLMVRVIVYGVKWSEAMKSNYEQFFTSDLLMPAGSKSVSYTIQVANNMDWYILAYEIYDAGTPYMPSAYRLSDTSLTRDLDAAQRIDINQIKTYNILISK